MAHQLTWPTIGVLALLGTGAGVHLGYSAIAEINPVHFASSQPRSSFHADLVPNRPSDSAPIALAADDDDMLGAACVGCRAYPEEYYPIHDASVDGGYDSDWASEESAEAVELAAYAVETLAEVARRKADMERVERYAHAPVTADEQFASAETAASEPQREDPPAD